MEIIFNVAKKEIIGHHDDDVGSINQKCTHAGSPQASKHLLIIKSVSVSQFEYIYLHNIEFPHDLPSQPNFGIVVVAVITIIRRWYAYGWGITT